MKNNLAIITKAEYLSEKDGFLKNVKHKKILFFIEKPLKRACF